MTKEKEIVIWVSLVLIAVAQLIFLVGLWRMTVRINDGASQLPPTTTQSNHLSDVARQALNQFSPLIREQLGAVRVKELDQPEPPGMVGQYFPDENLIEVNLNNLPPRYQIDLVTHEYIHALKRQPNTDFLMDVGKLKGTKYDYMYNYITQSFLPQYKTDTVRMLAIEAYAEIGSRLVCQVNETGLRTWYIGVFNCS